MSYIGNTVQNQNYVPAIDYFNGNGSTVAFTLSRPVASVAAVQAVVNNVPQNPGDAFTVSGSTITFTSAPPSGTNNTYVYYTSPNTQVVQPGQGTVTTTSIVDGSVTPAKLSTGAPTWDVYSNLAVSSSTTANGFTSYSNSADGGMQGYIGTSKAICSTGANSILGVRGENGIIFGVGNTERMRIDSSGRVTAPYQPAFFASNTTSGTSATFLVYSTAVVNVGSNYSTVTGRFTCPVAGTYQFQWAVLYEGSSIGRFYLYKNGANAGNGNNNQLRAAATASTLPFAMKNFIVTAAANDYFSIYYESDNAAANTASGGYLTFSGSLIG